MDFTSDFNQWLADQSKAFNDLQTQLTSAQQAASKAAADLAAANNSLSTANSRIAFLNTTITDQAAIIADLKTQLDSFNKKRIVAFNVHPFNSTAYTNYDNMLALVKQAGGNAIRANFNVTNSGIAQYESKLLDLMAKCKAAGIIFMPMVNIDNGDINGGVSAANAIANGLVKYDFDYLEFGNELAIKDWLGDGTLRALKTGDGDLASNYDTALLAKIGVTVKTMIATYKSQKPNVKVLLDGEWLHTYYMEYLLNTLGVKIDMLAWHFYSGQQIARNGKQKIRDILKSKFPGLPIIWNEIGVDTDANTGTISQAHYDAFSSMLVDFAPDDIGYYELKDETDRLPSKKEAGYGFFDKDGNPKPVLNLIK